MIAQRISVRTGEKELLLIFKVNFWKKQSVGCKCVPSVQWRSF